MKYDYRIENFNHYCNRLIIQKIKDYRKFLYMICFNIEGKQCFGVGVPQGHILYTIGPRTISELSCIKNNPALHVCDLFENDIIPLPKAPGKRYHWIFFSMNTFNTPCIDTPSGLNTDPERLESICKNLINEFCKDCIS